MEEEKTSCILSAEADETPLLSDFLKGAVKDVVCHSISDIAVIKRFLWLRYSYQQWCWKLTEQTLQLREERRADGEAHVPRQLNRHYINSLCQGIESGREENNNDAKCIALVESHWAKGKLGEQNDIHGKNTFTVMKAGDDILNHICYSWHSTQRPLFICIPFCQICPLNEVKVEWIGLAFRLCSCVKWHHCEDMSTGMFCSYSKRSDW